MIRRKFWEILAKLLYRIKSTYAIPTYLGVCISPVCNIKCPYCMRTQFTPPGSPMKLETLQDLLKRMPYIQGVCIMGLCEPFLNKDLPDMLRWLKSAGYTISLTTNGTVPIKDLDVLRMVDDFVISMDTNDEETFTYLRGGAKLPVVFDTFKRVIEFKRSHNLSRLDNPPLHINAVITKQNIHHIPGLIAMLEPYAEDITYLMVDPISRPDYQSFEKPLAFSMDEYGGEIAQYRALAKQSKLDVIGFDYMLVPSSNWGRCNLSWYGMFIQPNGDAYYCYDYKRVLGNVFKEKPLKVWNSTIARDFRKELLSPHPPIEQCRSCNFARQGWQPSGTYDTQGKIKVDVTSAE